MNIKKRTLSLVAALVIAFTGLSSPVEAQGPQNDFTLQLSPSFYVGFLGGASRKVSIGDRTETGDTFDLAPTFGASVNAGFNIADMILVGPELNFYSYFAKDAPEDANRTNAIGIGVMAAFHYPIDLGGMTLDPIGSFSAGFLAALADPDIEDAEAAFGFYVSIRAGATLWFTPNIGVALMFGADIVRVYDTVGSGIAEADIVDRINEGSMRIGPSFRF